MLELFVYMFIGAMLQLFFYWGITLLAVMMFVDNRKKTKRLKAFMEKALPEYFFCNLAITVALVCINDFRVVICAAMVMSVLYYLILKFSYRRFTLPKPTQEININQTVEFAK